jgi:hypothetical protein
MHITSDWRWGYLTPLFQIPGRKGDRGSISGRGERIFPLTTVSRPALGPTHNPVQWVPGVLSPGLKRSRGVTLTTHPIYCRGRGWVGAISPLPQAPSWRVVWQLHLYFKYRSQPRCLTVTWTSCTPNNAVGLQQTLLQRDLYYIRANKCKQLLSESVKLDYKRSAK